MRHLNLVIVTCLIAGAAIGAVPAADHPLATIQKFVDSFNAGDVAAAATTHARSADLAIIDEVAPFLWRGPEAFEAWGAALASESEKQGITDQVVKLGAPVREEIAGDRAYLVVPAVYTFKQGGAAMIEKAQMTFALRKGEGGWLIHGWAWSGPKPQAAATAKP